MHHRWLPREVYVPPPPVVVNDNDVVAGGTPALRAALLQQPAPRRGAVDAANAAVARARSTPDVLAALTVSRSGAAGVVW